MRVVIGIDLKKAMIKNYLVYLLRNAFINISKPKVK